MTNPTSGQANPTCPFDGKDSTIEHHIMQASIDLYTAYTHPWIARRNHVSEEYHNYRGAMLHTFDELSMLADLLGIKGCLHPEDQTPS